MEKTFPVFSQLVGHKTQAPLRILFVIKTGSVLLTG